MPKVKNKFIGGEYYYSPLILFKKKKFDLENYLKDKYSQKYFYFTGGGYYSIFKIIEEIGFENNQEILLPSYLCPTILIPFKKRNIKYRFFRINKNLEIDINDLKSKVNEDTKVVFFIKYFGFPPKNEVLSFLKEIKEKKIILIEDSVQSFFSDIELIGDYCFNSFRKFLPLDGSVIISNDKIKTKHKSKSFTKYFFLKLIGQHLRMLSINFQILDLSKMFLNLFSLANEDYYKHIEVNFNWWNKFILSKYDIGLLKEQRYNNYVSLLDNFKDIALIKEINSNIVPLGFPVLIKNRNEIRKNLISKNIFCPVHWILPDEIDKNEFKDSWYLSEYLLTIPINENFGVAEYEYFKKIWEDIA